MPYPMIQDKAIVGSFDSSDNLTGEAPDPKSSLVLEQMTAIEPGDMLERLNQSTNILIKDVDYLHQTSKPNSNCITFCNLAVLSINHLI